MTILADDVRRIVAFLCFAVLIGLYFFLRTPSNDQALTTLYGNTMGTTYTIKIYKPNLNDIDINRTKERVIHELDVIDVLMSNYRDDSEIMRFNRHHSTLPFLLSPPTLLVFQQALEVSEQSKGAFDITIDPLVALWGFGAAKNAPQHWLPDEKVQQIKQQIGFRHLHIDMQKGTVQKDIPSLTCDLSGVAQGYGVQRLSEVLSELGYADHMVEIGGEVAARGLRAGEPWRIGIERPDDDVQGILSTVYLRQMGVATSGNYREYRDLDGKRISHTIDPRSGYPITHDLTSVTVAHANNTLADAWGTAFYVLGLQEGLRLAEEKKLAALFVVRHPSSGALEIHSSSAFKRLLVP